MALRKKRQPSNEADSVFTSLLILSLIQRKAEQKTLTEGKSWRMQKGKTGREKLAGKMSADAKKIFAMVNQVIKLYPETDE